MDTGPLGGSGRLYFSHPQAVEVAVCVSSDCLFLAEAEVSMGSITGLQSLAMAAIFGLDIDPFDVVFGSHGMVNSTDIDRDCAVVQSDNGKMLFAAGFDGVGNQCFHLFAAADNGNAGVVDKKL